MNGFRLIQGGKADALPETKDFKQETIPDADIQEECIFTKGEIVGLMQQLARAEGIPMHCLEIESEVYDEKGNLVYISTQVGQKVARTFGWGNIVYHFMIKGKHGGIGCTTGSYIPRVYSSVYDPKDNCAGGIVAEYEKGEWVLSPGEIAESVMIRDEMLEKIEEATAPLTMLPKIPSDSAL